MTLDSPALYVVPTPLGNLGDMTQRAIDVLRQVPWVAAEDTRHSAPLLKQYGSNARLLAAHEHNEEAAAQQVIGRLAEGESVALVSDAGTPAVSDPGARLVARVRAAGFCYEKEDVEIMFEDAKILLEHGADGIAFGFLNENGTICEEDTKRMIDLIHSYNKEAVFHRAFDVTPDAFEAIETLIALGCDSVLTSGQKSKAMEDSLTAPAKSKYLDRAEDFFAKFYTQLDRNS